MATGVQVWSITASANSTADTNVNWAEGMAPSQENDSARAEMASVAKWRDDNNGSIVTAGSTVAYTVTSNQIEAALTSGYTIAFQMHATNDSSATLAVDGLTAKPLQVITGTNLAGGELLVGNTYRATYSTTGTGQWLIQGADALGSQPNIITATNISDNAVTYQKIQTPGASVLLGNPSTSTSTEYREITLGTNLSFSAQVLNAGNNTPFISVFTSSGAATWSSTTKNGNFPLYLSVRMVAGGGGGGAVSTTNGSSGTDTSFNNWTAIAGTGGAQGTSLTPGAGGSGGTNGTGTLVRRLGGSNGIAISATPGVGGPSALGGAGNARGTATSSGTITAAANSGSGGGGAGNGASSFGSGGGGGEYVEFVVTSPSTSYSYTVGGGGAGGVGGSNNGGTGGTGRIEVIAYWQ